MSDLTSVANVVTFSSTPLPADTAPEILRTVFQPIFRLSTAEAFGYEVLLHGPASSVTGSPTALFATASDAAGTIASEMITMRLVIASLPATRLSGRLFLNPSVQGVRQLPQDYACLLHATADHDLRPSQIVVELTEQTPINGLASFVRALSVVHDFGLQCVLDDFGTDSASLNLLIELTFDFVEFGKYSSRDTAKYPAKLDIARTLQQTLKGSAISTTIRGPETEDELGVVRDLGIRFGQGFFLAHSQDKPTSDMSSQAARVLQSSRIAVLPQAVCVGWHAIAVGKLSRTVPTLPLRSSNDDVLYLFNRYPDLHTTALFDEDKCPSVLTARRAFIDHYAMPYHRELYGRKSALAFADRQPALVEKPTSLEDMSALLTNEGQRYLTDGSIITEHGHYLGLGTGERLVRTMTEIRIETARYANPLTFLPGNIPLNLHIERLLEVRAELYACYVDLNHFKPFNSQYGYWQGDEMLKMAAVALTSACEPMRDLLGHVGGDDFLILSQSVGQQARIMQAMATFNTNALATYTPANRTAGGMRAEDRRGLSAFLRFATMAVGALYVLPGAAHNSDDIDTAAALTKRCAKQSDNDFHPEAIRPTQPVRVMSQYISDNATASLRSAPAARPLPRHVSCRWH